MCYVAAATAAAAAAVYASVLQCDFGRAAGLDLLLGEDRISDLALLFALYSRVKDGIKQLCLYFASYIKVRFT